jgi:hypothetical protein
MTWVRTGVDVEICHITILAEEIRCELPGTQGRVGCGIPPGWGLVVASG